MLFKPLQFNRRIQNLISNRQMWAKKKKNIELTHSKRVRGHIFHSFLIRSELVDSFLDDVRRLAVLDLLPLPDLDHSFESGKRISKGRCLLGR